MLSCGTAVSATTHTTRQETFQPDLFPNEKFLCKNTTSVPEHIKARVTALNFSTEIISADRTVMTSWWPKTEMLYPDSNYQTKLSNMYAPTDNTAVTGWILKQVRLNFTTCIVTRYNECYIWSKQGFKKATDITLMPQWFNSFICWFHTQIMLMSSTGILAHFGLISSASIHKVKRGSWISIQAN